MVSLFAFIHFCSLLSSVSANRKQISREKESIVRLRENKVM